MLCSAQCGMAATKAVCGGSYETTRGWCGVTVMRRCCFGRDSIGRRLASRQGCGCGLHADVRQAPRTRRRPQRLLGAPAHAPTLAHTPDRARNLTPVRSDARVQPPPRVRCGQTRGSTADAPRALPLRVGPRSGCGRAVPGPCRLGSQPGRSRAGGSRTV
jgi:hypothetical protein